MYPYKDESENSDKEKKEEELLKESIVKQYLLPKARERLNNLSLINPELVSQVKELIYNLAVSGRLKSPLTDNQLKDLLYRLQARRKKEFRFRGLW